MTIKTGTSALLFFALSCSQTEEPVPDDAQAGAGMSTSGRGGAGFDSGGSSGRAGAGRRGSDAGQGGTTGEAGAGGSGVAGGDGGAGAGSSLGGAGETAGAGATGGRETCSEPPVPGLPASAPVLELGRWVDITPGDLPVAGDEHTSQGLAIDRCNPGTIYFCVAREGGNVYKSTDGGGSWTRLGGDDADTDAEDLRVTGLTFPIRLRVDPNDSNHLYAGDGVEGSTLGFWRSFDGGRSWEMPETFLEAGERADVFVIDVYDVAADPSDFRHVLVSSHSDPYVLESKDGGDTWTYHATPPDVGTGHSIGFLYAPELGLGDSKTWLLGTQGGGYFRTVDGGESWDQVSDAGIVHGGGNHYYAKDGTVYATAEDDVLRSTDNGATWERVGLGFGTSAVHGDGAFLYTTRGYIDEPEPAYTSPEDDGLEWKPFQDGAQPLPEGIFEMAFDETNRVLYAAGWGQHVWALKVP